MKYTHAVLIAIGIIALSVTIYSVNAQISEPVTRKEYVYCPVDVNALDKSVTYEINGCPTVRIYVENYNTLDTLTKTNIDTTLKSQGFKEKEAFGLNELTGRIKP